MLASWLMKFMCRCFLKIRRGPRFTWVNQFVVTSSLTKAFGLSGLRCGWIFAEPELAERMWRPERPLCRNARSTPANGLSVLAAPAA
jgi:aspartate/methionine/tyrosine aminotransferase